MREDYQSLDLDKVREEVSGFASILEAKTFIREEDVSFNPLLIKNNLKLTGEAGSGKTTVGKLLAEKLGREFVDTDEVITEKYGNITAIFDSIGETGFRDIESGIIKEVSALQAKVIATGGGAILRQENIDFLKQNGKVYFLDRPLEQIVGTADRPLSQNSEMLKKRYEERYDIYCGCCDKRIISQTTPKDAVCSIEEDFYK